MCFVVNGWVDRPASTSSYIVMIACRFAATFRGSGGGIQVRPRPMRGRRVTGFPSTRTTGFGLGGSRITVTRATPSSPPHARSKPMASALSRRPRAQGTVGGSGRAAGAFGWSLRPMLGEGVPLSGPIRGQTRPRTGFVCACDLRGFSGRLQDDAVEHAEGGGPRRGGGVG
jgi:hypothetical protein